jgi:hypothetical protein
MATRFDSKKWTGKCITITPKTFNMEETEERRNKGGRQERFEIIVVRVLESTAEGSLAAIMQSTVHVPWLVRLEGSFG